MEARGQPRHQVGVRGGLGRGGPPTAQPGASQATQGGHPGPWQPAFRFSSFRPRFPERPTDLVSYLLRPAPHAPSPSSRWRGLHGLPPTFPSSKHVAAFPDGPRAQDEEAAPTLPLCLPHPIQVLSQNVEASLCTLQTGRGELCTPTGPPHSPGAHRGCLLPPRALGLLPDSLSLHKAERFKGHPGRWVGLAPLLPSAPFLGPPA